MPKPGPCWRKINLSLSLPSVGPTLIFHSTLALIKYLSCTEVSRKNKIYTEKAGGLTCERRGYGGSSPTSLVFPVL